MQLNKNYKYIVYILGQLYDVHATRDGFLYLKNFSMNYKGKPWIQSREVEKALKAFFNLIALGSTSLNPDGIVLMGALEKEGLLGGYPLDLHRILWCCTEMNSKADIDRVVEILKEV